MSEPLLISEEFAIVIDTNGEVLDFASKLCAYCTGLSSEADEDLYFSDMFYNDKDIVDEENPFVDFCVDKIDANGDFSPCSVWLNKNYGSNENGDYAKIDDNNFEEFNFPAPFSVGIFFNVRPTEEHVQIIKERASKFLSEHWNLEHNKNLEVQRVYLIAYKKYAEEIDL